MPVFYLELQEVIHAFEVLQKALDACQFCLFCVRACMHACARLLQQVYTTLHDSHALHSSFLLALYVLLPIECIGGDRAPMLFLSIRGEKNRAMICICR